ncbi:DNA alkylation repair protein [Patescibacteria group bacterium]|nr:DNA alkylation repair protein [Patescibacteria group bacterium]MBU1663396.1 DNA alkylation repair protein [Patescibacteria group bacterium]MBU1933753.1 DNA alkylation repair protein [Patescibacteria group bacterium]MBU2008040.1 DNA alkylation repair protein [Patescibacteria group bacterium]MBU2233734.1 DNA alkylation repair protein [Patescibacteria group bacterium]
MNSKQIIGQIRKELKNKASTKTEKEKRKARAIFGNETKLLALKVPETREIAEFFAKKLKKEKDFDTALKVADELYKSGVFEEATVAESILKEFKNCFDDLVFDKLDGWIDYIKNWANIDMLCGWLITPIILKDESKIKIIFQWAKSKNRWRRRAAAVSLVKPVRKGIYLKQSLQVAESLIQDKDDMVQKGVGWLLKEAGGKFPEETVKFLMKWRPKISRLVLRLACEKLPPKEKSLGCETKSVIESL